MRAGAVDTSFVAVSDTEPGRAFLDWWQNRSESVTWRSGTRLLDRAIVALDGPVLVRDPGWNLGRWTAGHRDARGRRSGGVLVDGRPLVWTNFEGVFALDAAPSSTADATRPGRCLANSRSYRSLCTTTGAAAGRGLRRRARL